VKNVLIWIAGFFVTAIGLAILGFILMTVASFNVHHTILYYTGSQEVFFVIIRMAHVIFSILGGTIILMKLDDLPITI
jgi:hypothetical protein